MKNPKRKRWHREDIKAEVRKRSSTLRAVSMAAGYSANTCTVALIKPMPGPQKAISDFIGEPLHVLWPKWYNANGERIASQSTRKASPKPAAPQCKKSAEVRA